MVTNALGYIPPKTDTTYDIATAIKDGLMSCTDKKAHDLLVNGAIRSSNDVSGFSKVTHIYKFTGSDNLIIVTEQGQYMVGLVKI